VKTGRRWDSVNWVTWFQGSLFGLESRRWVSIYSEDTSFWFEVDS
jgi:hypothetical protein